MKRIKQKDVRLKFLDYVMIGNTHYFWYAGQPNDICYRFDECKYTYEEMINRIYEAH